MPKPLSPAALRPAQGTALRLAQGTALLLLAAALPGCTFFSAPQRIAAAAANGESLLARARSPEGVAKETGLVTEDRKVWLGDKALPAAHGTPLPADLLKPDAVRLVTARPQTIGEIAALLSQITGMRVEVSANLVTASMSGAGKPGIKAAEGANPVAAALDSAGSPAFPAAFAQRGSGAAPAAMTVDYPGGPLDELLDIIASRFGVAWRYTGRAILFSRFETETFTLANLPTDLSLENAFNSATASQASSQTVTTGTTSNTVSEPLTSKDLSKAALDVWKQVTQGVENIVAGEGEVTTAPATGLVTVTTTPRRMEEAAAYIRRQNRLLLRQVAISTTVLAVDINKEDQYGTNISLLFQHLLPNSTPLEFTSPLGGPFTFGAIAPAPSNPTNVLLQGNSAIENASVLTSASVTTLNDKPVPIQVATQTSYLASVQSTIAVNAGSTTSLTPGTVTSGVTMTMLPRILSHGRILLEANIAITELQAINTVSSGGESIEVPTVDTRSILQQAYLKSGDTLILAGFGERESDQNANGLVWPLNLLTGGQNETANKNTIIVIMITPVELPPPAIAEASLR